MFRLTASLLLIAPALTFAAQPPPEPLISDVHAAPYRASLTYSLNVSGQRFEMRNATIVNLIDFARGRPDDDGREDYSVAGGPSWIDLDRFDVAAVIPSLKAASMEDGGPKYGIPQSSLDRIRPVVQRILAERFHLKYHAADQPLPGYLMTVGKDGAKLTQAKDPQGVSGCESAQDKAGQTTIACTAVTIAQFLATFSGTFRHPIFDRTGLGQAYDFTLRFSAEQMQTREDSIHAYMQECGRQLGLAIVAGDVPQPAIVVDAVERVPTSNAPEPAKRIPAMPEMEFEVATIRPAAESEPQRGTRLSGSQISLISYTLQELMTRAWEFRTGAMIGNRPEWLPNTRYTILMKLPPGVDVRALSQNSELFDAMLRKLLTERFQMNYHWGEQEVADAYVLHAGTPKMKKADPAARSFCKYGPVEGERDVRTVGSAFDGQFHCQNVTMDQFADLAQAVAGSDIKYRVPNRTGLIGAYDFVLFYTSARKLRADATAAEAAAPVAGLSIEDAFRKQLGLKLEKEPGLYPALVLDHIEQTPTEN